MHYFTVGPSKLFPTAKDHLQHALDNQILSYSHRSDWFRQTYQSIHKSLSKILSLPKDHKIIFYSSATECMERVVQSLSVDKTYHFVCGAFSRRFEIMAEDYGRETGHSQVYVDQGEWFDFDKIGNKISLSDKLKTKILTGARYRPVNYQEAELATFCLNETSTGVQLDPEDIYKLKQKFPNTLTVADAVTVLPLKKIDFNYIDACFFSIQKVFGLPAGLGVLILSKKAQERAEEIYNKSAKKAEIDPAGSYFNINRMLEQSENWQTPHTPNILAIYLLGKTLEDFQKIGIDKLRQQTTQKAKLIYQYFDKHQDIKPLIKPEQSQLRSETAIALSTPKQSSKIVAKLKEKNVFISSGYGRSKGDIVRIANFPAISLEEIKNLLKLFDGISLKN